MQEPLNLQDAIFNLQKYLRALSFVDERITRPPLDGIFDSATEEAVRSFQNAYGVGSDGLVDKATWDAIYEEYKALDDYAELPFFPSAPESYTAKLGEESAFVGIIQVILRELSSLYDLFSNVEVNGIYDTATENAIRELQRASGLKITGELDNPHINDFLMIFTPILTFKRIDLANKNISIGSIIKSQDKISFWKVLKWSTDLHNAHSLR